MLFFMVRFTTNCPLVSAWSSSPGSNCLLPPLRDRVQPCARFPGQHDALHYWLILVPTLIQILALILSLSVIQLLAPIRFLPLSQLGSPTPPSVRLSAFFPHRFLILTPSVRILPHFQHKLTVFVLFVRVIALFTTPASMAASRTLSVSMTLVLTASIGKNSQLGTCLRAAAWKM